MMSCATISLVPEARGGPFIFWDDLAGSCRRAAELGFDAVEIFPPSAAAINAVEVEQLLSANGLCLAAVGTGAGWVKHRLTLTDPDAGKRKKAFEFVRSLIDAAGALRAPAIIGSMQGRWTEVVDEETALNWLADSLAKLGEHAAQYHVPLIYEPLNRYETNMCNTLWEGLDMLKRSSANNVGLLADLFHMNIEERSTYEAIIIAGESIRHVHFVDSNRRAAGCGHINFQPVAEALHGISYDRFLSAEAFPLPDSETAARVTIDTFDTYFGRPNALV